MTRFGPSWKNSDEGVTIPLLAVCVAVLMTFTAFGVDIARQASRNRDMQRTADAAALDSSRVIDGRTTSELQAIAEAAAAESADRNGDGDATLQVVLGWIGKTRVEASRLTDDRMFYASGPDEVPNAVLVRAVDGVDYFFNPTAGDADRLAAALNGDIPAPPPCDPASDPTCAPGDDEDGIEDPEPCLDPLGCDPECPDPAGCEEGSDDPDPTDPDPGEALAGFEIGSNLASADTGVAVDANDATLLSRILETALGDSNAANGTISVDLVGWQGLAAAVVSLDDLAAQLGFASPQALVDDGSITVRDLVIATATVLANDGNAASAAVLNAMSANMGGAAIDLADMILIDSGGEAAALEGYLNIPQLLTGSAFLADGDHAISVSNATLGIPNLSNSTLNLTLVEAPRWAFGPEGTSVSTAQMTAGLSSAVNLGSLIPAVNGVTSVTATGTITLNITGGGATGTSTAIECVSPKSLTVGVTTNAVNTTFSTNLTVGVVATGLGIPLQSDGMAANGSAATPAGGGSLDFLYPTEFNIPTDFYGPKTLGSHRLDLDAMNLVVSNPLTNALIQGLMTSVQTAITGTALPALLQRIDDNLVPFLSAQLGVGLASADVWAESLVCNPPTLVI